MREIDPKITGPGTWAVLHALACVCEESRTNKCYRFYAKVLYRILHAFPCSTCRKHAVEYLDQNPAPLTKKDGSPFEWSVNFHNTVNKRLNKPLMILEDAKKLWSDTEVILSSKENSSTCSLAATGGDGGHGCEDAPL